MTNVLKFQVYIIILLYSGPRNSLRLPTLWPRYQLRYTQCKPLTRYIVIIIVIYVRVHAHTRARNQAKTIGRIAHARGRALSLSSPACTRCMRNKNIIVAKLVCFFHCNVSRDTAIILFTCLYGKFL